MTPENDQHCRQAEAHQHHHHHLGWAEGLAPRYVRKLQIAMGLAVVFFITQVLGGILSGSLALLADAGHKLADIGAIGLALLAAWFAHHATSKTKTFGLYRLEILAALLNALALVGVVGLILWEAYERLSRQAGLHIEGGVMLWVAAFGLLVNLLAAWVLYPAREFNLNVKGALFHLMADIASSLGTMLAALAILRFQVYWFDAVISVAIAFLVLNNALRLLVEAVNILMETAPHRLDVGRIRDFILQRPGVTDVHDLHVWTITTGKDALLAHVRVSEKAFTHETARNLENDLRETYDLCHITVQLEPPGFEEIDVCFIDPTQDSKIHP